MTIQGQQWLIFPTALGHCGVAWRKEGVTHFMLPETTADRIRQELQSSTTVSSPAKKIPVWVRALLQQIKQHMKGQLQDFSNAPVFIETATDFMNAVYTEARKIPAGSVISYAELASRLGKSGAVRAVGTALGKNPVPLIIPCHRIISASGALGGFSANGGVEAKKTLLACEGVSFEKPMLIATSEQWRRAVQHLQRDKAMKKLINRIGQFSFKPRQNEDPLEAFIDAIVSQQLATKVAATILQRVHALINVQGRPSAKKILATDDDVLRGAGLSFMKVSYLKDLARHSIDKKLPTLAEVKTLSNEQLIKRFTAVKGIGRWSVEMYLIFDLGRADVFPVDDYGIRKAIAKLHGLPELPPAKQMMQYGEQWEPYRSVASLYLWRSLDMP